jgi:hypothetical protein
VWRSVHPSVAEVGEGAVLFVHHHGHEDFGALNLAGVVVHVGEEPCFGAPALAASSAGSSPEVPAPHPASTSARAAAVSAVRTAFLAFGFVMYASFRSVFLAGPRSQERWSRYTHRGRLSASRPSSEAGFLSSIWPTPVRSSKPLAHRSLPLVHQGPDFLPSDGIMGRWVSLHIVRITQSGKEGEDEEDYLELIS